MYRVIGTDGKTYGPVNLAQLRQWIVQGRADSRTAVFVDGHAQFHKWSGSIVSYGKAMAVGTSSSFTPPTTTGGPDYDYVYMGFRFPGWKQ